MENFTCIKCNTTKNISCFYKSPVNLNGIINTCKDCHSALSKKRVRTIDGLIKQIYRVQKQKSKRRGHPNPEYSQLELKEWILNNSNFNFLYYEWEKSEYKQGKKPSIDRINDYIHYTLSNIRLTTWDDNNKRAHTDRKIGINNKVNHAIIQYDINMNVICEHHSVRHASRVTSVNRWNILTANKENKLAGGFYWKKKK